MLKTIRPSKFLAMVIVFTIIISTISFQMVFATVADSDFELTAVATASDFNKGDTVTVKINALALTRSQSVGSFQFQLNWDEDLLTLTDITTTFSGTAQANTISGKFAFSRNNDTIIAIGTETPVNIATATFQVKETTASTSDIDFSQAEITPVSYDRNDGLMETNKATINLHNIKVSFVAGVGTTVTGAPIDAYAKYNAPGLYTTQDYTTEFQVPSATAQDTYCLYNPTDYWLSGGNYYSADDIESTAFTANTTYTATAEDHCTVTSNVTDKRDVATDGAISLTFTEAMNIDDMSYVTLKSAYGEVVTLTPSTIDNLTFTFAHAALVAGKNYNLVVPTGLLTVSGKVVNGATFTFRTATLGDPQEAVPYELKVVSKSGDNFNKGDTVTVKINALALTSASNVASFQFQLNWDENLLTLTGINTSIVGLSQANTTNGKFAFSRNSDTFISIGTETPVEIATATFKVKETTASTADIDFSQAEITPVGYDINDGVIETNKATINLHNITVSFVAGAGTTVTGAPVTAYAKYNAPGLYTTQDYTTVYEVPVATAQDTYRLYNATHYWLSGGNYYSADDIETKLYTTNTTYTATAVKRYTVTADANGGSFAEYGTKTFDVGTTFDAVGLPAIADITPPEGMTFIGWKINGGETVAPELLNAQKLSSNSTAVAQYSHNKFTWIATENDSTITVDAGCVVENQVTHGTDVTFTVTPDSSYIVTSVKYKVGQDVMVDVPVEGGKYKIAGSIISDNVTVEVSTKRYHTITFKAGEGVSAFSDVVFYAGDNSTSLYTSLENLKAGTSVASIPAITSADGYRLRTNAEGQWHNGSTFVSSATIFATPITANATYTAEGIKTCTVTFIMGSNGKWSDGTTADKVVTVDQGYRLVASDIPGYKANPGYTFDAWIDGNPLDAQINGNGAFTVTFKYATYAVSFTTLSGITPKNELGETAVTTATHNTDYKFKLDVNTELVTLNSVSYSIGGVDKGIITPDGSGVYTIAGAQITGIINISYDAIGLHTVTFNADANGLVVSGATQYVETNGYLTQAQVDNVTVTPADYYEFAGWYDGDTAVSDLKAVQITANKTFTAKFTLKKRTITSPADVVVTYAEGYTNADAVYGIAVKFTVTSATNVVFGISYNNGVDGNVALTPVDGVYTIPATGIKGNIILTATKAEGQLSFISRDNYRVIVSETVGKQVIVFETELLPTGTYTFDGTPMYYSVKYDGYVALIPDTYTSATAAYKISVNSSASVISINYNGDVNGANGVTAADAGIVNDSLHNQRGESVTEAMMIFMCDINGDKQVTTDDIILILIAATSGTYE